MKLIDELEKHISRLNSRAKTLEIKPSATSTDINFDDIQRIIASLRAAEGMAVALQHSYDVVEWPADGSSMQDKALAAWKDAAELVKPRSSTCRLMP